MWPRRGRRCGPGCRPGCGGQVVDGADLGHAFAVAFLSFGQPGGQLGGARGRCFGGGGPQRLGAHDDAFAVAGQHEHITVLACCVGTGGVELVEVGCCSLGKVFNLAFAELLSAGPSDGVDRVVEGTACGLDGGETAEPVGVALVGKVQRRVGEMQVGVPASAVGETFHFYVSEHRGQAAVVAALDGPPADPVGIDDALDAGLALRTQVQVVLEQPAQKLTALDVETHLQLGMVKPARVVAAQPGGHRLEPFTRLPEPVAHADLGHRCRLGRRAARRVLRSTRAPSARWSNSALAVA